MRRAPCCRRALDVPSDAERLAEELCGLVEAARGKCSAGQRRSGLRRSSSEGEADALLVLQRDDAELVEDERVVPADLLGRLEVLLGELGVGEAKVLHADEEEREVRPGEVPLRRRVGRDGLVVLALVRERVRVREPRRAEARIDENGFAAGRGRSVSSSSSSPRSTTRKRDRERDAPEEPARFLPPFAGKVPQADGVPADRVVRLVVDHVVRDEEQLGAQVGQVVHAREVQRQGEAVRGVEGQDAARRGREASVRVRAGQSEARRGRESERKRTAS